VMIGALVTLAVGEIGSRMMSKRLAAE
jgi:hypothetical protein